MWLLALVFLWVSFGGLGAWIAPQKGRATAEGFVLGFVFGPLGVLVEALLPTLGTPVARRSESRVLADDRDELPAAVPLPEIRPERRREAPRAIDRLEL